MEKPRSEVRAGRPIRLLWLIDSLTMGGAERLVPVFANRLDRDRFDLRVACLKVIDGNPFAAELEAAGVPVTVLNAANLRDVMAFIRLIQLVREQEIDLIHTHLTYADIWGRLAGRLTGRPVVSTVHAPSFFNYWKIRRRDRLIESIAGFTRKHFGQIVIGVSEALRQHHISRGFPPERIITVHNGIELSKFEVPPSCTRTAGRVELGLPTEAPVVITLAMLREGKGHDKLLAAGALVLKRLPEVKFLIVGGGPREEELRLRVKSSELADSVIFTGMRADVANMVALADLFVLPSEFDPLPTVILEAMAMRLPVVAFDSGGVPEMVVDGETGLLVASGDCEALAEAIVNLLTNRPRVKQMGYNGRARVEGHFTNHLWVSRLEQVYYQVLGQR